MAQPTKDDPLGLRPEPTSIFEQMEQVVDRRIEWRLQGQTSHGFDGVPDMHLVHELLAQGWAVFRPQSKD